MSSWAIVPINISSGAGLPFKEMHGPETEALNACRGGQKHVELPVGVSCFSHFCTADGFLLKTSFADPAEVLASCQAMKDLELSNACQDEITSNMTSSALGSSHTYPSKIIDQQNLTANVLSSLFPGLASDWVTYHMCADTSEAWAFRPHTAAQIQAVGEDMKSFISAALIKLNTLRASVYAATTPGTVVTITWAG